MEITEQARNEAAAHLDLLDFDAILAWRDSAARLMARHNVGTVPMTDESYMRMLAFFEYCDAYVQGQREIGAMVTAN